MVMSKQRSLLKIVILLELFEKILFFFVCSAAGLAVSGSILIVLMFIYAHLTK